MTHVTNLEVLDGGRIVIASCACGWTATKTIGDVHNGRAMMLIAEVAMAARTAAAWHRLARAT